MPTRYGGGEHWIPSQARVQARAKLAISPEVGKWWFLALYETPLLFSGLLDHEGRVLEGNQVSIEGCGLVREEVIGRPFWEGGWWRPDPALAAGIRTWCRQVLSSGDSLRTTTPYFLADGTLRMVDLALHPVFDGEGDSGTSYIVATGLDITDALTARAEREERLAVEAEALRMEAQARIREFEVLQESELFIRERLGRLASAAIDMVGVDTLEALTRLVFDRAFPILGADGGALIIRDQGELQVFLSDRLGDATRDKYQDAPFDSPWPGRHVARSGERLILSTREEGIAFLPEMVQVYEDTGRLAWVYVPLKVGDHLLGSMAVSWREEREIGDDELALIESVAAQCAQVIERIQITRINRENALHLDHMVESIQRSLLTSSPTSGQLDIGTQYVPAAQAVQVGGDWYDAFTTKSGSTLLVVGDVAGHDGDAAAAMAQLRNLFRGIAIDTHDGPASLLGLLDEAIHGLDLGAIATVLVAELNLGECVGTFGVRWASAGHLPPMLKRADGSVEILAKRSDLLLGVNAKQVRNEHSFNFGSGDTLLFYTDGLVERRTEPLDTGLGLLAQAFGSAGRGPSSDICGEIVDRMLPSAPGDDVVVMAVQSVEPITGLRSGA
jgi:PAS domain S-box-containing protein